MGFVLSTHGIHKLLTTAMADGYSGLRAAIIVTGGSITDAAIEDAQYVNQIIGVSSEAEATTSGGYTSGHGNRITIAGVVLSKDTATGNYSQLLATAPVVNTVGAGSGVWRRILYYFNGASDAANEVLGVDTPTSTLTPNGGNITLPALQIRLNDTSV